VIALVAEIGNPHPKVSMPPSLGCGAALDRDRPRIQIREAANGRHQLRLCVDAPRDEKMEPMKSAIEVEQAQRVEPKYDVAQCYSMLQLFRFLLPREDHEIP
jgi:hypothetical protein